LQKARRRQMLLKFEERGGAILRAKPFLTPCHHPTQVKQTRQRPTSLTIFGGFPLGKPKVRRTQSQVETQAAAKLRWAEIRDTHAKHQAKPKVRHTRRQDKHQGKPKSRRKAAQ